MPEPVSKRQKTSTDDQSAQLPSFQNNVVVKSILPFLDLEQLITGVYYVNASCRQHALFELRRRLLADETNFYVSVQDGECEGVGGCPEHVIDTTACLGATKEYNEVTKEMIDEAVTTCRTHFENGKTEIDAELLDDTNADELTLKEDRVRTCLQMTGKVLAAGPYGFDVERSLADVNHSEHTKWYREDMVPACLRENEVFDLFASWARYGERDEQEKQQVRLLERCLRLLLSIADKARPMRLFRSLDRTLHPDCTCGEDSRKEQTSLVFSVPHGGEDQLFEFELVYESTKPGLNGSDGPEEPVFECSF